jgi:diamine N-acetyltransferase
MTVQIRRAILQDYPSIAAAASESQDLHAAAHPAIFQHGTPGFAEEYVRSLIEDERSAIYVADEDEHVVGYAFLHVQQTSFLDIFQPRMVATITDIAVTYTMRGKGIGRLLFEASLEWAKSQNAERLELIVWEFNREALTFYERRGMQTLARTMSLPLT